MATYRYLFADLLSGTLLEELPVTCTSFARALNAAGNLSCSLNLSDLGDLDWRGATEPRRTGLYVERDDRALVWGGVVWKRRPGNGGQTAEIEASTFESYFAHRRIKQTQSFTAVDVFGVARALLASVAAEPNGAARPNPTAPK